MSDEAGVDRMDLLGRSHKHWTAEGKTEQQLAPRYIDGEWYLHVSDTHNALAERDAARDQLRGAVEAIRAAHDALEDAHLPGEGQRALRAKKLLAEALAHPGGQ